MKHLIPTLLMLFAINLGAAEPEQKDFAIEKSLWLHNFGESYSTLFCEKLREKKNCKSLNSSECLKISEQSILSCAKKMDLPTKIEPGLLSKEIGARLGACAGRKTELHLIEKKVCNANE